MTLDDVSEAVSLLGAVLNALQAAVPGQSGRSGAAFRYACGDLIAQAPTLIPAFALGSPLEGCFTAALSAGATLSGLAGVRQAVTSFAYTSRASVLVGGACYSYALSGEVQVLTQATFPCSEDASSALAYVSAAIQAGEDWTLDQCLPVQYQALLELGAAVTLDLQARVAALPRVTTYSFPRGASSLVLAYRIYGDAGRADELRAENQANNPAFMPPSGTALSE